MCANSGSLAGVPQFELSALMKEYLGVTVDPFALKLFVNAHWGDVSRLAHAMHDEKRQALPKDYNLATAREFGVPPQAGDVKYDTP